MKVLETITVQCGNCTQPIELVRGYVEYVAEKMRDHPDDPEAGILQCPHCKSIQTIREIAQELVAEGA